MATQTVNQLRRELQAELDSAGYGVKLLPGWPAKATYYNREGRAMPNLPADPFSMRRYLARGFTLVPPDQLPAAAAPGKPDELKCESCGKGPFRNKWMLKGHMRSHKDKEEKAQ